MSSVEERRLLATDNLVQEAAREIFGHEEYADARLSVLEAIASSYAGWDVKEYWARIRRARHRPKASSSWPEPILASIRKSEIPVPLALAALAREDLPPGQQRKTGAYYTDWRLAEMLATSSVPQTTASGPWVDPACGSGMLLVAAALAVAPNERDSLIGERLCGADLSERALRGTLLSVASLTHDLDIIARFRERLILGDSLRSRDTWKSLAPNGFALVIGNPPWERLRASRHEAASANGHARHYGQSFSEEIDVSESRALILEYLDGVVGGMSLQGKGSHDLYKLFLELGLGLAAEDGVVAQIVPAGLIRSQGTKALRAELDALARDLEIMVLENRQRHFDIDSRFKFLAVIARVGKGGRNPIILRVADRTGAIPDVPVTVSRAELKRVRPDLTIPEVRTDEEWQLFARLSREGVRIGDSAGHWHPKYLRELDMTMDRKKFERRRNGDAMPVVEGRHVAQYRYRAKEYVSGEGRAALWVPQSLQNANLKSQWFIHPDRLRAGAHESSARARVGFCDITGQTNERTLLAARIPAGVVCGNKVPTLTLSAGGEEREDLFIALVNSLPVDWLARRLVTTTVNFFLLDSIPLPEIDENSPEGAEIIDSARRIMQAEGSTGPGLWQIAKWRARIDALTAKAWGMGTDDLRLVLNDFPLLDRGQPGLTGENRSTITADLVILTLANLLGETATFEERRVHNAIDAGAVPFVPAEYSREDPV